MTEPRTRTKIWMAKEAKTGTPSVSFLTAAFLWRDRYRHLCDAGLPRLIHDFDNETMLHRRVGIDENEQLGVFLETFLQCRANAILGDGLFVDANTAVGGDGYRRALAGRLLSCSGFRQIDREAAVMGHGQSRDHENNQQKKDRVDHRADLDAGCFY